MKKPAFISFAFLLIGGASLVAVMAQPAPQLPPTTSQAQIPTSRQLDKIFTQQFIWTFADRLEAKLKNKSVGYTFFINKSGLTGVGRAGGDARRAPDTAPRKWTVDDKINIASVSKTFTAAAVLKLLNQKQTSVDRFVYTFLPTDWTLGANVKSITFRDLLTHRSGIRCGTEVTYVNVRQCFANGVNLADKNTQVYNNNNYAVFRMIIPILNGFKSGTFAKNSTGDSIASSTYATLYIDYIRENIFLPAGVRGIECRPVATNPALSYQFPTPVIAGDAFGDMTETNASRGWNMSSRQLSGVMQNLLDTEKLLPASVTKKMKEGQLGIWMDNTSIPGIVSYEHGGYYPGKNATTGTLFNQGELNSLMINFSNGISVGVIVNSQYGPNLSLAVAVKAALKEALGLI
jgi:CubicO group peptidase (beta-lactamase class C family)